MKRVKINAIDMGLLTLCFGFAERQKIIVIDSDYSGASKIVVVNRSLSLKKGFVYIENPATSCKAYTNPVMVNIPVENKYSKVDGTIFVPPPLKVDMLEQCQDS